MADISKISTPNGTEYTLKARTLSTARTIDGVDFNGTAAITHYGTCSTAKGTAAKVVDVDGFKLVTGAVVWVRFTVTNSAAVGNLTLNVNGTGAKHIKYRGENLGSVGYLAAGRTYPFVYDGTYWELACDIDTTTNIGNNIRANCAVVQAGTEALESGEIIVAGTDGLYIPLNSGNAFDIKYPIFREGTATAAGETSTNNYYATTVTVAETQDMTLTPQEPIYIKGHLSGTTFTPVSTTPLTQTVPTTADGYQYIFLGVAYSATSFWLSYDHPVYAYIDGAFQEYDHDTKNSVTTFTSSDVADGDASSWTTVTKVASGEKHSSLFAKISQMFKNVRYLYKLLGTTDISSIGNGTVTNALSVLNANQQDLTVLPTPSGGDFGSNWQPNGACYRRILGKEVHIHASLRGGGTADGSLLMSGMGSAADFTGPITNMENKTCGYWRLLKSTQEVRIYNVTSNNIMMDIFYYRAI